MIVPFVGADWTAVTRHLRIEGLVMDESATLDASWDEMAKLAHPACRRLPAAW